MARLTILMATYNGERFLKEQLASFDAQSFQDWDLWVSDDGSKDQTKEILRNFKFNSFHKLVVRDGPHEGFVKNFLDLTISCENDAEYFAFSDQDDIWLPNKVEISLSALKKADLVLTNCSVVDEKGEILIEDFFSVRKTHIGFLRNLWKNTYLGCCMAFRRDFLNIIMPLPRNLPIYQDGWIGALIDICGTTKIETSICMYYRRHLDNVSSTSEKSKLSLLQKIRVRVLLFYLVIRRICFIKWNSGL